MLRLFLFVLIFTPSTLFAFNRGQTCISSEERAERGELAPSNAPPCQGNDSGKLFHWDSNTLTYSLHDGEIAQFPGEQRDILYDEIRQAFQIWEDVSCTSLRIEEGPLSSSFGHKVDDQNWIGFYDTQDWPHSRTAVSVAVVSTLPDGLVVDVDIEINSGDNPLTIDGAPKTFDVRNFMAHEAGHFIGLDHSSFRDATMQFEAGEGQTKKRDLHPDDEAGVCEIYPQDSVPKMDDEADDGCCSTISAKPNRGVWILFSLLFAASFRRLRR